MRKNKIHLFILFCSLMIVFFLFPSNGLAVEFSITDTKIDAYLLDDGNVQVKEVFTYQFDGEFNGITREIIPKQGTKISSFKAFENGKRLRVEKEEHLYKIHRKGEDETITIQLTYKIHHAVDVYADVAQFYWPFFDDRNESTYENLIITIHPPSNTTEVIAFGYDEAFDTEKINAQGVVTFTFGEVPSGENGDIRVAYDAKLFPNATITANKQMKDEILKAKDDLYNEIEAAAKKKEKYAKMAAILVPVYALLLFFLMFTTWLKSRLNRAAVRRELEHSSRIPKQIMSLPATIVYTNGAFFPGETMAAALLDLVRQGAIVQIDEKTFKINEKLKPNLKHEQILLEFLFKEIGRNGTFCFDDLTHYTKIKKNHQTYQSNQTKWLQAVKDELKQYELYENKKGVRLIAGLSSLVLAPFLFLFPANGLIGWFALTLSLFVITIIFALAYHPKTFNGLTISEQWNLLRKRLMETSIEEWSDLQEEDKMRVYIYAIGIKAKKFINNKKLIETFELPNHHFYDRSYDVNMATMLYVGTIASTSFHNANDTTQTMTSTSSSSFSSGGGTGGGGGGSGAF